MSQKYDEHIQALANKLIEQIKENKAPWQKPWTGAEFSLPVNHQGTPYQGVNSLNLMIEAQSKGYTDNRWFTYNNAKEQGGQVKRGEKGTPIIAVITTEQVDKKDEQGNIIKDENGKPIKETVQLDRPIIKQYYVFNAEQINGIPPRQLPPTIPEWERHAKAEEIINNIQKQGLTIVHQPSDRAFYRPSKDQITMPERSQFTSGDLYYATLLHEIGHATGHESRLNRDLSGSFGSISYAKEELRAEIASMMIGQELQIGHDPSQHHAYLQSWVKVLEDDPKELVRAVKDADVIKNYVLELGRDYTPLETEINETKEQVTKNPNTNIAQENTPINVPYKEKNEAKALGAKWDSKNKTWYVPTGEDLSKFGKWYSLEQSLPNQKEIRTAWGDFPPVISNGKLRDLSNEPEYQEAKSGNFEQSVKLVDKLIKDETVQHIKEIIGDNKPIIVPILSEEASGKNRIPQAYAYALANELNLQVTDEIFQSNTAKRTGKGIYHRYVSPPEFSGNVQAGQAYFIVDDTLSVGGTIATLKGYIENNGGKVIGSAVMTAYEQKTSISISQNMLKSIEQKDGLNEYWREEFGFGLDKLTQQEAGHLKKPTLEQIQQNIQEARQNLLDNQRSIPHNETNKHNELQQRAVHTSFETDRTANIRTQSPQQQGGGIFHGTLPSQKTTPKNEVTQNRTYLYTSYKDADAMQELKKAGVVSFDIRHKVWYLKDDTQADKVKQWTYRPYVPTPEEAFANHLKASGINVTAGHPIMDGRPHRLSNDGSNDKNVMYQFYPNQGGVPAGHITNFSRGGVAEKWVYPKEYLHIQKNIEAVDMAKGQKPTRQSNITLSEPKPITQKAPTAEVLSAEKQALHDKTAQRVAMAFSFATLATAHEYLNKKQVTGNNVAYVVPDKSQLPPQFSNDIVIGNTWQEARDLRNNHPDKMVLQKGNLMIPQFNAQGELRAFETIGYQSAKYALKNADKQGLSLALGQVKNGEPIIVAEGYATGATLHEHTNKAVVVAFGKGGLLEVSKQLREHCPDSKIYIGADNDHQKPLELNPSTGKPKENTGLVNAQKVADSVPNVHILIPQFDAHDKGKDWNDVYVDKGIDEFKRQIRAELDRINSKGQTQSHEAINQEKAGQEVVQAVQEHIAQPKDPLDIDVIKQSYPTISDNNIKSVQAWKEFIASFESQEVRDNLTQRLENKLPDLANGEQLPTPQDMGKQVDR